MNSIHSINIFDFIAFLLYDLESYATTKAAGLESLSYDPADSYKEYVAEFINKIKTAYNYQKMDYFHYIVNEGIPAEIYKEYLNNYNFRINKDAVFYLVNSIVINLLNSDSILKAAHSASRKARFINKTVGFKQLNSDKSVEETKYIILPDLGTFGDENKINRTTTNFEKIYLKGLIILTISDLCTRKGESYEIRNILPEEASHYSRYPLDGKLVIAVSPISDRWLLKDQPKIIANNYGTKEYLFECDGITDEEFIKSRIVSAYRESCSQGAHILLFPEMFGTEDLSNHADDVIKNHAGSDAPLIVMPSWWHDNMNTASVVDDALVTVYKQSKFNPFLYSPHSPKYQHNSREYLQNTERIIYIYHLPGIGRICICICKDFLMDSYRRMLSESLEASIILIPAFSPKIEHFTNCMDELKHAGSYGVFVNCCAARCSADSEQPSISKHDTVGAISITRALSDESDPPLRLLHPTCNGNCGGDKTCCVFIIKITTDGTVSIEHVHKDYS